MGREEEIYLKYLTLFGLEPGYNIGELTDAYHTLAKLNHPDLNKDKSSKMRMVLINKGHEFLKDHLLKKDFTGIIPEKNKVYDKAFVLYKEAFNIMKDAFDAYFGENSKKEIDNIDILKERLQKSKALFARIVKSKEYNHWISDAIDKINSINKWL